MCQKSVLSHIPIEAEWLVLSVNQERTQKMQKHLSSVVTESFAHEINNGFSYCQVYLSSLGCHGLSLIKDSFIWPVCVRRQQTADRDPLGSVVTLHPLLGGGKLWANATPNASNPLRELPLTGRTSRAREGDSVQLTLCCGMDWEILHWETCATHLSTALVHWKEGWFHWQTTASTFLAQINPQGVHSVSLTELITVGACSYSAEILNNRPMEMHSLTMMILR